MKHLVYLLLLIVVSFAAKAQVVTSPVKTPVVRSVPDSVVGKMKKDKEFAYADDMSYWKKAPPRRRTNFDRLMSAISQSAVIKLILYSLVIAAILYALYQIMVVNNFFIFSGRKRKRNALGEPDDVLQNEDLEQRIDESVTNGNYRLAIRYLYLKTLKLLSDKNVITLHAKSTNQDYIHQMYKHDSLPQFRQLTRVYEYVWYGEFEPTKNQFEIISTNFQQFNKGS